MGNKGLFVHSVRLVVETAEKLIQEAMHAQSICPTYMEQWAVGTSNFWDDWNTKILARIREELRPEAERDQELLEAVVSVMAQYRAAKGGHRWDMKRSLPPRDCLNEEEPAPKPA